MARYLKLDQTEVDCRACNGTGWIPRDPDIGTDQECFVCEGCGKLPKWVRDKESSVASKEE